MPYEFTGNIIQLFGDGQKPNGWFAGILRDEDSHDKVHIAGIYKKELDINIKYDIIAEENSHPKYGKQYKITSMAPHIELDEKSILLYLSGASFKGIGPVVAKKIVDKFGTDSLSVIANDSDKLKSELGLTDRQVSILVKGESSFSVENKLRKLVPNISETLINKIVDTYCDGDGDCGSNQIIDIIRNEPYSMLYKVDGVKFKDIDEIALAVKFDMYDETRLHECYKFALRQYTKNTGNLFIDTTNKSEYNAFYAAVLDNVGYPEMASSYSYSQRCINAVYDMFVNPSDIDGIMADVVDGRYVIYDESVYDEEIGLSEIMAERLLSKSIFIELTGCTVNDIENDIAIYEKKKHMKLDPSQHAGIIASLLSSISIINGGPGHGKTSTIECILFIWHRHLKEKEPILSAPTGRAVTVLKNATGNEYEVATAMRRIVQMEHLTKLNKKSTETLDTFEELKEKYSDNIVILDECSMIGVKTAYNFMKMFDNCQFIFVGDVDQLPSIEYGQFFKDICDCNLIMKTCLTENHRAEGKIIIDNAEHINNSDIASIDFSDADQFEMMERQGDFSDAIINEYKNYVYDIEVDEKTNEEKYVLNRQKMQSVCILCPTSKGPTGTLALNHVIQDLVNPYILTAKPNENGYEIDATHMYIDDTCKDLKLRVGDRVMQTKNRTDAECEIIDGAKHQYSTGIFNGDTGTIKSFHMSADSSSQDYIVLCLDDGRVTNVYEENMKELILAYAMTFHKSQGSEYDEVIMSLQDNLLYIPGDFACKNLLYTGVTRAKKHVKLIGNRDSFNKCVMTQKIPRNSMLMPRILQEVKQLKS